MHDPWLIIYKTCNTKCEYTHKSHYLWIIQIRQNWQANLFNGKLLYSNHLCRRWTKYLEAKCDFIYFEIRKSKSITSQHSLWNKELFVKRMWVIFNPKLYTYLTTFLGFISCLVVLLLDKCVYSCTMFYKQINKSNVYQFSLIVRRAFHVNF